MKTSIKIRLSILAVTFVSLLCIAADNTIAPLLALTFKNRAFIGLASYSNLNSAKNAARAGDTIYVSAGNYTAHNLWKPGVNWHGMPGANITWTDTGDSVGIFDDRGVNGGTNTIIWPGTLEFLVEEPASIDFCGAIAIGDPDTILRATIGKIIIEINDGGLGTKGGAVSVYNCRAAYVTVDEILDTSAATSYASGFYWEQGLTHFTFQRMVMDNGYGLWFKEPAGTPITDVYVKGQYIEVNFGIGFPTCLRFTGINPDYRAWVDVLEIKNKGAGAYAVGCDGSGGKLYLKGQKVGSVASAFQVTGGTMWVELDKVSATGLGNWVNATDGTTFFAVRHWEDTGTLGVGWKLEKGFHTFGPGYAAVNAGKGIEHFGGTNRFTGLTINTRGTDTATTVTNHRPVTLANGASNLVLNSCVLLSPIATVNGGAYAVFTTNTATPSHLTMGGTVVCNSNLNTGVVPIISALLTQNQPQLR